MSAREPLGSGGLLLLDGGTGSELRRRGLELSDVCWSASVNLEHGALLEAIHRDYIAAGADIVTANTFGTSRFVLAAAGLGDRFEAVNRAALRAVHAAASAATSAVAATSSAVAAASSVVAAASSAVAAASSAVAATSSAASSSASTSPTGRRVLVAASLSCMPPRFDRRAWPAPDEEYRSYVELAELFAAEGVDIVLLEMLQAPEHAGRACRAVRAAGLPFMAGLSCRLRAEAWGARSMRSRESLVSFDDPALALEPVLDTVLAFEPDAVAIMHSPLDAMLPALDLLRSRWRGAIGAYAEIPYPEDPEGDGTGRISPELYAESARSWIDTGARIVGGCCGTTPAHIAAVAAHAGRR